MEARDLTLRATDGYPLAATLYRTPNSGGTGVVLSPAKGTPRRFYGRFA